MLLCTGKRTRTPTQNAWNNPHAVHDNNEAGNSPCCLHALGAGCGLPGCSNRVLGQDKTELRELPGVGLGQCPHTHWKNMHTWQHMFPLHACSVHTELSQFCPFVHHIFWILYKQSHPGHEFSKTLTFACHVTMSVVHHCGLILIDDSESGRCLCAWRPCCVSMGRVRLMTHVGHQILCVFLTPHFKSLMHVDFVIIKTLCQLVRCTTKNLCRKQEKAHADQHILATGSMQEKWLCREVCLQYSKIALASSYSTRWVDLFKTLPLLSWQTVCMIICNLIMYKLYLSGIIWNVNTWNFDQITGIKHRISMCISSEMANTQASIRQCYWLRPWVRVFPIRHCLRDLYYHSPIKKFVARLTEQRCYAKIAQDCRPNNEWYATTSTMLVDHMPIAKFAGCPTKTLIGLFVSITVSVSVKF